MTLQIERKRQLIVKKETVKGTEETPDKALIFVDGGMNVVREKSFTGQRSGKVEVNEEGYSMKVEGRGEYTFELNRITAGVLMNMYFGDPTTGGGGPYTYTFALQDSPESYTFADQLVNRSYRYPQTTLDSLSIEFKDEFVEAKASFISKTATTNSGIISATPTDVPAWTFAQSAVKVGTTVSGSLTTMDVRSFSLNLPVNLKAEYLSGSNEPSMIEPAARENWNGEMVIFFEDEVEYNKFIADTTQAMVVEISDGTYSLTINMDKVLYEQVDIVKEDDFIAAKFSFQALFDTTNSRYGNAVLVSSEATI